MVNNKRLGIYDNQGSAKAKRQITRITKVTHEETDTTMHYTQYLATHVELLKQFKQAVAKLPPYNVALNELTEDDQQFMQAVDTLCSAKSDNEGLHELGQWLVDRIIMRYEHLLPYLSRDLLWFFGGNSLHHMSDEEIGFYQQLDELRYAAESQQRDFNLQEAKAFLMANTHKNN